MRDYGGVYKLKIGLINADELNMGGFSWNSPYAGVENYLRRTTNYWTLSPYDASTSYAFVLLAYSISGGYAGSIVGDYSVTFTYGVAPVINLKADVSATCDGTSSSPFKIN